MKPVPGIPLYTLDRGTYNKSITLFKVASNLLSKIGAHRMRQDY